MKRKPDWRQWLLDERECQDWLNHYLARNMLRKSKDEASLYIERAQDNFAFAQWVMNKNENEIPNTLHKSHYDWTITISYYAVYHAIAALVNKEGYSSKSHMAILCFIILHHFHKNSLLTEHELTLVATSFNKEDIQTVGSAKELRERACYDVHESFEKTIAERLLVDIQIIIDKVNELLR